MVSAALSASSWSPGDAGCAGRGWRCPGRGWWRPGCAPQGRAASLAGRCRRWWSRRRPEPRQRISTPRWCRCGRRTAETTESAWSRVRTASEARSVLQRICLKAHHLCFRYAWRPHYSGDLELLKQFGNAAGHVLVLKTLRLCFILCIWAVTWYTFSSMIVWAGIKTEPERKCLSGQRSVKFEN